MEPNVFLGILKTQYPMYYEDFEKAARRGNCRKERAENLVNHLKEMKGKQFKDIQNGIIETSNSEKRNTDDALRIGNTRVYVHTLYMHTTQYFYQFLFFDHILNQRIYLILKLLMTLFCL